MESMFPLMEAIARTGLANQKARESDYYDDDNLLVCGVCGERRQEILSLLDPTDADPEHTSPLKVTRECLCDRTEKDRRKKEEQAVKELQRLEGLRKASLIDERFSEARFDKFRVNAYNERNLKLCKRYTEKFDLMLEKNQGLLLWGDVGTGKTFAAACIANALLDKSIPVIMTSFVRLLSLFQKGEESDTTILSRMKRAKLVIFDDLGAERGTDYALEKVYSIVDERYRQKLPSIFTTNMTMNEMEYEEDRRYRRIYDRIFGSCYPMQFTGPSWRRKEAGHRFAEMEKLLEEP